MTPLERLAAIARNVGAERERLRIAQLINDAPGPDCECSRWTVEIGFHAPDCHFEAVQAFRADLIASLFAAVSDGPAGVGRVPGLASTSGSSASAWAGSSRSTSAGG